MEKILAKLGYAAAKTQHIWVPKVEQLIKEGTQVVANVLKNIIR